MSDFLCNGCARASGVAPPLPVSGAAPSPYQVRKDRQHAVSGMTGKRNSLFVDPSRVNAYRVDAYNSGYVEIDASGRTSWNMVAHHETGVTLMSGTFLGS